MLDHLFIARSKAGAVYRTLSWSLAIAVAAVISTDIMYREFFPEIARTYGPQLRYFAFAVAALIAFPITLMFFRMSLRMSAMNTQFKEMARRDGLTGLLNRSAFEEHVHNRRSYPRETGTHEDALIIVDIDHFKKINDTHGHAAGDHVLRVVSVSIAGSVFERDHVARVGGEEFAVLSLNCGASGAVDAAERIRAALEDSKAHFEGKTIRITASVGGALFPRGASFQTVYQGADYALYRAKNAGRNRCEFNGLPTSRREIDLDALKPPQRAAG
jgi:diguanylate cyclase (GGDEF)-like protein